MGIDGGRTTALLEWLIRRGPLPGGVLIVAALACGPADAPPEETDSDMREPVVLSLLGERLYAREDSTGAVQEALDELSADASDIELLLAAGHAYAGVWDYVEAIRMYSRAIDLDPDDWRGYRFRGHRYVSIRRLPNALRDLEAARARSPHSFDVAYHLGLAHYVAGSFRAAAEEYGRCMRLADDREALELERSGTLGEGFRSCMSIATDDNARVAISDWRFLSLVRSGQRDTADALLATISPDMTVSTNTAYHHALLFYRGLISEDQLLDPENPAGYRFETVGYPVAAWHLAEGDTARAITLLERVASHPHWPGFGRIAAEADLTRLDRSDVR